MKGLERLWSKTVSVPCYSTQYRFIPVILFSSLGKTQDKERSSQNEARAFLRANRANLSLSTHN